ncbi:AsmA-like C-terminal region-containing protein [Flavobacterium restrictum]|uniref:AsmA-like C-terminal region-containing protein n=1 Tax=Flavobacterium restrictum TaxID=2594428 RepID=UPI001F1B8697|nr:AsmA-like C-terminal region-containing protein [Flavobacterium restrictum]
MAIAKSNNKSIFIKIIKYTGVFLAVLLSLLFLTPILFADKIKVEIKKYANTKLNGELNYTNANVSFFHHFPSLTLTLDDFDLKGAAPFQKEKFITAKEVSFGINVRSLVFSKSINIDQIYLENANINVKVNKEGLANYNVYIASKEVPKKEGESTALRLEKIEIKNSQIRYDDQSTAIHFDLLGFNYLGKGDLSQNVFDLSSNVKIATLNMFYQNEPYLMNKKVNGDLITKVNVNSLSFIFEQNDLKINKLPVDFKGKFDFLKDGYSMDFTVKSIDSDLYDLITAFPPKYITWLNKTDLKGKTDVILTLKGTYNASQNQAPDLNLDFKIRDGFVNYNKSKFPVEHLNFDFSTKVPALNPEQLIVDLKNISLNVQKGYLKAKLYTTRINNITVDGSLKAAIDLEKLNQALGIPDITLKGILEGNSTIKGIYNPKTKKFPVANATINLKNGYLKTPYYPNPITDITVLATVNNQKGDFNDLKVTLKPTQFTFEGKPFTIEADLNNFNDLTYDIKAKGTLNISKIYHVFSQKGLDVDGFIKADLALKGKQSDAEKGNYTKLDNKGTLEVQNIVLKTQYLPKKLLIKEGIFTFKQDKMAFNTFLATYGESDFKMNGYLQNVFNFMSARNGVLRGAFTLQSKYINTDEFLSVSQATPTDSKTTTTAPSSAKQTTGVILIPPTFNLQFQAYAQKINFQGIALQNANGALKIKDGKLKMQNTNFNLIGCQVTMNASYQSITPQKAQFEYAIKANDFDIKRAYNEIKMFRKMASAAEKAQGTVSLDYTLKGKLNADMAPIYPSLIGNGVLSVKDIKIHGMKMFNAVGKKTNHDAIKNPELSKVAIKSSIKNNIITIERFKFKFAGFRPRIEGTTSLDGRLNIKMRLGLPPLGILGIPILVTGNKDNPKIKIGRHSEDLEETKDSIN